MNNGPIERALTNVITRTRVKGTELNPRWIKSYLRTLKKTQMEKLEEHKKNLDYIALTAAITLGCTQLKNKKSQDCWLTKQKVNDDCTQLQYLINSDDIKQIDYSFLIEWTRKQEAPTGIFSLASLEKEQRTCKVLQCYIEQKQEQVARKSEMTHPDCHDALVTLEDSDFGLNYNEGNLDAIVEARVNRVQKWDKWINEWFGNQTSIIKDKKVNPIEDLQNRQMALEKMIKYEKTKKRNPAIEKEKMLHILQIGARYVRTPSPAVITETSIGKNLSI